MTRWWTPRRVRRVDALVTVAATRRVDERTDPGPTFDAIRIGVGLERVAWLATWDVDARACQPPTVTGTFE